MFPKHQNKTKKTSHSWMLLGGNTSKSILAKMRARGKYRKKRKINARPSLPQLLVVNHNRNQTRVKAAPLPKDIGRSTNSNLQQRMPPTAVRFYVHVRLARSHTNLTEMEHPSMKNAKKSKQRNQTRWTGPAVNEQSTPAPAPAVSASA